MQGIGSGLGDDVDHRACGTPDVGAGVVGIHLDLGNRIDRGTNADETLLALVVVHAINHFAVVLVGLTVGDNGGCDAPVIGTLARGDCVRLPLVHPGLQLNQVDEVASVEWQILHRLLGDHAAHGGTIGLQERRRCTHFHRLLNGTGLKFGIGAQTVTGGEVDIRNDKFLEALSLDRNHVMPWNQEIEDEIARPVRLGDGRDARPLVGQGYGCPRDCGAGTVRDCSEHVGSRDLRIRGELRAK